MWSTDSYQALAMQMEYYFSITGIQESKHAMGLINQLGYIHFPEFQPYPTNSDAEFRKKVMYIFRTHALSQVCIK